MEAPVILLGIPLIVKHEDLWQSYANDEVMMTVLCKVIPLKTAMTSAYDIMRTDLEEPMDGAERAALINKILCVAKEMEDEWENDHSSPAIRDKIHLFVHYLRRLQVS